MKSIIFAGLLTLAVASFGFIPSQTVLAATPEQNLCSGADLSLRGGTCVKKDSRGRDIAPESKLDSLIRAIINIFSIIVGIVAVVMIIVGGFRFITSGGDSGRVGSARQTVIYALIGLIIVALAQVIVRFILTKI